ncbi:hypothetical protein WH52_13545 [Tenacibaculum holothuriorum]|uniref:HTH araC/xylS-type domain-containing protein n=1 Tax=Tenacibaculum holothuriorum TaxID=1635173 RepID=A0A1Y2PA84_9FLAO|nr:helix-turn-helix domain-containing protein [Tenacibaculum holothuriorum]OSY87080.1 hypothetical protein WH52_13545 [Tenacibaculum holothuriorum]
MRTFVKILLALSLYVSFVTASFGQRSIEAKVLLDSISKTVNYNANPHVVIKLSEKLLQLGEKEKDTFLILRALHHLGRRNQFANENLKSIAYFKKELDFFFKNKFSEKVKNELIDTEIVPVEIYAQLGNNYATLGDTKTALDYFNISKNIAEKENLPFYKAVIPILIGEIKASIKEYDQAIKSYKTGLKRLESSKEIEEKTKIFNSALTTTSIVEAYLLKNDIDSAKIILNQGIKKGYHKSTIGSELTFEIAKAVILTKENKLEEALKQYKVAVQKSNEFNAEKGVLYYYRGYAECLAKLGKYDEAAELMEKGIEINSKEVKEHSLSEDYKQLAKYYKTSGNIEKSNQYFEKYVLSQSALEKNKRDVIQQFHNTELETLNSQKEKQLKFSSFYILGSSIFIALLLFYLFILSRKRKRETKNFNELLDRVNSKKEESKIIDTKEKVSTEKTPEINPELTQQILKGLQKIEEQEYYLKQECNLYNVAKKIKTNTSYLSKVINAEFQKNFNTYINDLRINYTLIKLKNDTRFRSYSIKSIAEEVGYKSADSFSKYFKRRTGLLPSVFIKKLNNSN